MIYYPISTTRSPLVEETLHFLMQHGQIILFIWIFIDQFGLPLPVAPLLLAAGALAGSEQIEPLMAVFIPAIASFSSNIFWYEMGRLKGSAILGLICKIALEPDTYVLRSENAFLRYGKLSLLLAKFIPGMNAISASVAGVFNLSRPAFLLLNALGSCLWAGAFVGAGYLFRHQLEAAAARVGTMGSYLFTILSLALIAYVGFRYIHRYRAIRALRGDRITPEELKQKLDAKADVVVIDLRHPLDAQQRPGTVPGAMRIAPEELSSL